jgi:hypothetical protein
MLKQEAALEKEIKDLEESLRKDEQESLAPHEVNNKSKELNNSDEYEPKEDDLD